MAGRKPAARQNELHRAARAGDIATVRVCLAGGATVDAVNEYEFKPPQCAAMGADRGSAADISEVMRLLIEAGALLPAEFSSSSAHSRRLTAFLFGS